MATKKTNASASAEANEVPSITKAATAGAMDALIERETRDGRRELSRLQRRDKRILGELATRGIAPGSTEAKRRLSRFLRHGSPVNAALTEAALLESRAPEVITGIILELSDAPMHKKLDDDWYYSQDQNEGMEKRLGVGDYPYLRLHARLYIAGKIAGRAEERCRGERCQSESEPLP